MSALLRMTNSRLCLICIVIVASVWVCFFNLKFIAVRLKEFTSNTELADAKMWKHFGIESKCKTFIKYDPHGTKLDDIQAYRSNLLIRRHHRLTDLKIRSLNLDINGSDILVILHIQKTGGTYLEDNLALNTNIQPPVRCKEMPGVSDRIMCACLNVNGQDWMLNRHCTGWACGLHPGFMELTSCVDRWFSNQANEKRKRNYHYITMMRDPVTRFISEWLHVRRGATWKESQLLCDGTDATLQEVPFCFKFGSWKNVSFDEFINCSSNMAFNRQTRMLANLSLSDCYRLQSNLSQNEREEIMLQSAKDNLSRWLTFFGIVEYIEASQILFEKTFIGLKFNKNMSRKQKSFSHSVAVLSEAIWARTVDKNRLDIRLYQYAKDIFLQRLAMVNITIHRPINDAVDLHEGFTYIRTQNN